jgi:hypothetical protein
VVARQELNILRKSIKSLWLCHALLLLETMHCLAGDLEHGLTHQSPHHPKGAEEEEEKEKGEE